MAIQKPNVLTPEKAVKYSDALEKRKIAVSMIHHYGDEALKVFEVKQWPA